MSDHGHGGGGGGGGSAKGGNGSAMAGAGSVIPMAVVGALVFIGGYHFYRANANALGEIFGWALIACLIMFSWKVLFNYVPPKGTEGKEFLTMKPVVVILNVIGAVGLLYCVPWLIDRVYFDAGDDIYAAVDNIATALDEATPSLGF